MEMLRLLCVVLFSRGRRCFALLAGVQLDAMEEDKNDQSGALERSNFSSRREQDTISVLSSDPSENGLLTVSENHFSDVHTETISFDENGVSREFVNHVICFDCF